MVHQIGYIQNIGAYALGHFIIVDTRIRECTSSREMVICIWPVTKHFEIKFSWICRYCGACENDDDEDGDDEFDSDTLPKMLYDICNTWDH